MKIRIPPNHLWRRRSVFLFVLPHAVRDPLACFRMRADDREGALAAFGRAFELDPERTRKWSAGDVDLDPIRAEVSAITG